MIPSYYYLGIPASFDSFDVGILQFMVNKHRLLISVIEEVKEKIISGEIEVPSSKEAFEAAYGDAYELD